MVGGDDADVDPGAADLRRAQAGRRLRLRARRPGRRRALRQDGPQRHRVRHHAGLRRGLRAAGRRRHRDRRARRVPQLAAGHGHPVLAARPAGAGRWTRTRSWRRSAGYAQDSGEGRWTVEAAIDHAVPMPVITRRAVRPVRLPAGRLPGDEGRRRPAQPVRRPRRHRSRSRRP